MSCEHDCKKPPVFPLDLHNRPALPRIQYRIGDYGRIREHLLDSLNKAGSLTGWTHRGADDPGIALLESSAVVGDILTFYQELYANEGLLRTAGWRESIADLVKLTGYRLAPGVGGEGELAVTVKEGAAVTVPAGFGFKARLEGDDRDSDFESTEAVTAHPHLGRFHLYTPPEPEQAISAGASTLELAAVDGAVDIESRSGAGIAAGDRLMLVPATDVYDGSDTSYAPQAGSEILVVRNVETRLDRVVVELEGALTESRGTRVTAYAIDRNFRHAGHDAPNLLTRFDDVEQVVTQEPVAVARPVDADFTPAEDDAGYYSSLEKRQMPLDREVGDLAAGGLLICTGYAKFDEATGRQPFTVVRAIDGIEADTVTWAGVGASVSVLQLDGPLFTNAALHHPSFDIRSIRFYEVTGPALTLRAPREAGTGAFTDAGLQYFGTYDQVRSLAGRRLLLAHADGRTQSAAVTSGVDDFSLADRDKAHWWMWPVALDQVPRFAKEDFARDAPRVTVYGNLVPVTQGKSHGDAVLGGGDARRRFQTFKLPKAPLTYLMNESATPPEEPELDVYVDGVLWRRVDTFFHAGPADPVYVVREDDAGDSWVQFGDGLTGMRPASGSANIVARFRTGNGAAGGMAQDKTPSASGKLVGLDQVFLPEPLAGGGEAESGDNARQAAPGATQSLDRLVGLADYEAEALKLSGVLHARADWGLSGGVPGIRLMVLTESGTAQSVKHIRGIFETYSRCRGAARHPVAVVHGRYRYVYLALSAGHDGRRRPVDIEADIAAALGVQTRAAATPGHGLFALAERRFGAGIHESEILAAVQRVDHVTWVRATALQPLGAGEPDELAVPAAPAKLASVDCPADRILALHEDHLVVQPSLDQADRECEP